MPNQFTPMQNQQAQIPIRRTRRMPGYSNVHNNLYQVPMGIIYQNQVPFYQIQNTYVNSSGYYPVAPQQPSQVRNNCQRVLFKTVSKQSQSFLF